MAQSERALARSGLIGPKQSAKLAVLRQTRSQKGQMATFEHKFRDEGKVQQTGHTDHRGSHINEKQHGKGAVGRGQEMPSRSGGRATGFAAGKAALRGSRTREGGGAEKGGGSYVPGPNQIDEFPQKQRRMKDRVSTFKASPTGVGAFPTGTGISGSGSKPVAPASRGGTVRTGGYYGSPNRRTA